MGQDYWRVKPILGPVGGVATRGLDDARRGVPRRGRVLCNQALVPDSKMKREGRLCVNDGDDGEDGYRTLKNFWDPNGFVLAPERFFWTLKLARGGGGPCWRSFGAAHNPKTTTFSLGAVHHKPAGPRSCGAAHNTKINTFVRGPGVRAP